MPDWKENLKAEKKRAKAAAKAAKKAAKAAAQTNGPAAGDKPEPTPAERAAAAAEQHVRLQRWRLIVALAGVVVALIGALLSAILSFG